ncbi:MAG TPA: hypothetical protein ENN09_01420 [Planctomycetes bacterium]|nr:hypothetical protein [Planctomycetota bacterium]
MVGAGAASQEDEYRRRIGALERELGELRPKVAELEKERNALARSAKDKDALIAAKDAEIAASNKRLNEAQTMVKNGAETITNLQGALQSANGNIEELKGTIAARDKDIAVLKDRVAELERELGRLQEELKNRVTIEETERFYEEKKQTEERVNAVALEIAATREALGGVLGKSEALSEEIKSLQNTAGKFDNLPDITKELADVRSGRDKAARERDLLKSRISELENVLAEVQRQMDAAQDEPRSVWQRGAARLFGFFNRTETQASRTPPPVVKIPAEMDASDDVVLPEEVEELGDEDAAAPIPIGEDELFGDAPPPNGAGVVVGALGRSETREVPDEGVDIGNMKTNVLPKVNNPAEKRREDNPDGRTVKKRRRFGR